MIRLIGTVFVLSMACSLPQCCIAADDDATKPEVSNQAKADDHSGSGASAMKGTPKIDGEIDEAWSTAAPVDVKQSIESLLTINKDQIATAKVQLLWDADHLYVLWHVSDPKLSASSSDDWAQDSIELFVDRNHEATATFQSDDAQYRVNCEGKISGQGPGYDETAVQAATKKTDDGYIVEMSVAVADGPLTASNELGLELQVNNDDGSGERVSVAKWIHAENDSWESTSNYGTLTLK